MNKNKNLIVIFLIFIIPIFMYMVFKNSSQENNTNIALANCSKPTVLDFSSEMCLECQKLKGTMDQVQDNYKDKIIFKKISINSNKSADKQLIKKYNITVVPTLVFLNKQGKQVMKTTGSMTKSELEGYLNKLING